ncbi:acyl-CoA dehydrogenase family protein [Parageobacillus thermoglucosidasius]|uniref:acyl-CoA dehydrogenase family protein n=1 Tax=Parageobacillus thermoglucosidasius TaxID=1426 RepID=UPI000B55CAC7|nr:acyl-CoA dehydrogenase family protein [Parageobacillus thermoglucosidasius]OUM88015.1 MAG: cyclohexanecarboxyl-CoA dehydrogenase [Parageobacillus thermoglucosidasius]
MLNFSFSQEQNEFRKVMRDFAKTELLPTYLARERQGILPQQMWKRLGELGLTGLRVSAEYGGSEVDCVTAGIAVEEIGRGDFNVASAVSLCSLIGEILSKYASSELKKTWLPPFASGDKKFGIAVTEPGAGSDAAAIRTKAVRRGNSYIISGEKSGITLATVADAFIVFAKTEPELGARGVSAFLVPADLSGLERRGYEDMGNIAIGRGSLYLDQVEVPKENLIGEENKGFYQVMNGFDLSRILLGLQCLGAAMQTLDETIEHVKTRHAFGRPLAQFQGVSFPIVDHFAQLELVRWHCYRTLWLRDQGAPHTVEAAMCKWLGPKVAQEAIHECLLLNGHYAYTKEMAIEQRLRDVIGMEIGDGTAQIQKLVIARGLLGRE